MTTRTTLSAPCPPWRATQGQPGEVFPALGLSLAWLVDSCSSRDTGSWPAAAPLTSGALIANLELEFRLTYRKLSPLKISNRKFFAIFNLAPAARIPRLSTRTFVIANARLEIPATCTKQSSVTESNREQIAIFHLAPQLTIRPRIIPSRRREPKGRITSYGLQGMSHGLCSLRHTTQIHFSRILGLRYAAVTGHAETRREEGAEGK
jgi:hypothetical protein